MATNFPGAIDSFSLNVDNVDTVVAADVNNLQDAVVALETLGRQAHNNLLYDTLTGDASWQGGTTFADAADDTYLGGLWNNVNVTNPPDWSREAGGATDPFEYYLRCTHDADSQAGIVQFLGAKDTIPLRGKTLSLSADLWGTGVTSLRMAVLEWTGTADSVTSDVVSAWGAGNPTLAASLAYIGTPAAITVSSTRGRKAVNGLAVSTSANNLAVFIWTDAVEASTDLWNVARVKLEIADEATDFVARNYTEELTITQRYFLTIETTGTQMQLAFGYVTSTTNASCVIPTPVPMRTAPTITTIAATIKSNGVSRSVTSVGAVFLCNHGVKANFGDSGAGLTANHTAVINDTGGLVILDARL